MAGTIGATLDIFAQTPHLNRWIFDRLRPWCGQRVLEVGAGLGNITSMLLDRELVVATEIEAEFLRQLGRKFAGQKHVVVRSLDLNWVPVEELREHRLDTVLCVNVLEHVEDDLGALDALRRSVVPGGRLCLYVPALRWLYGSLDRGLVHHRRYGRAELADLLGRAGWKVDHLSFMNLLGIPGWFLNSRVLGRKLLPIKQVVLYDKLTPILRIEDRVRLPIGMSLVAAATAG
jgi:SAM-dependent methyltransferase